MKISVVEIFCSDLIRIMEKLLIFVRSFLVHRRRTQGPDLSLCGTTLEHSSYF